MKLFVTGGAGFIGSNFVRGILERSDDHVTVYDALTYAGNRANLEDLEDEARFRFVLGDICDRDAVLAAMDGHDAVVHFAAESHVDRSIVNPDVFVRTNCSGTNVLCEVAREVAVGRFLHISTDEVYGSIDEGSFSEGHALVPRSPYSASKAGSDLIALSHHTTHGLPVIVTRSSNNFGPYQFPEKVIPLFVTNLLDGLKVPLYGDGGNIRDWCYVDDNCRAVDLVLRQGVVGEIYNIGGGNEITNRELTLKLLAHTGRDESFIEPVADRLGHDRRYSITTAKVAALGWRPQHQLDEALTETVDWYRSHREWWEPLRARAAIPTAGVGVRVLVTGASGQVGLAVQEVCAAAGDEVFAAGRETLDATDRDAVLGALSTLRPDAVVHCAAWTAVDACEADPRRAFAANGLAVRWVAEGCRRFDSHLVHLSTDYVFSGEQSRPYVEWDRTGPLSVYGASKLAGEHEAAAAGIGATIARTSWVVSEHPPNMLTTIVRLLDQPGPLSFVDDQIGHVTFTGDLARMLRRLAVDRRPGIHHVTNQGPMSWFNFARVVAMATGHNPERVAAIATADLVPARPATRPLNSVLENAVLAASGLPLLPDVRESLPSVVEAIRSLG